MRACSVHEIHRTDIWNVKAAVYMTALSAATVGVFQAGVSEDIMPIALWGPIGVGCLISFILKANCRIQRY
jgi:hypothetical protein